MLLLGSMQRMLSLERLNREVKIEPKDAARLPKVGTHGVIILGAHRNLLELLLDHVSLLT